jgi:nucleotide-binding universal stress UspA family protein
MFNTIVVASEGSADTDQAVEAARALATVNGSRVVVAHVNELVRGHMGSHPIHANEVELQAKAREQVETLRAAGVTSELAVRSVADQPAKTLADIAESYKADLIITTTSRRRFSARLLSQTTSQRILRLAPCPILVLPRQHR